jgi:hypothetical protein
MPMGIFATIVSIATQIATLIANPEIPIHGKLFSMFCLYSP